MVNGDVFLYHLDNELQKLFSLTKYSYDYLYSTFKRVTRVGFLICKEKILIPASNYFESDMSFRILNELKDLNEIGAIHLISSSYNLEELLEKKIGQHGDNVSLPHYHYNDFLSDENRIVLPGSLRKRERSATSDIRAKWLLFINQRGIKDELFQLSGDTVKVTAFEDALFEVPRKLGSKAYISDYILPLLPIRDEKIKAADHRINAFITKEYIASFLQEYNAACLKDIPIIDSGLILPDNEDNSICYISYSRIAAILKITKYKGVDALTYIDNCGAYELIEFKNTPLWLDIAERVTSQEIENNISLEETKMFKVGDVLSGDERLKDDYSNVKIGIITALPKEFAAMLLMLDETKECFFKGTGAGHRFFVGQLRSADDKVHRIAVGLCGMGTNKAAIRATNMLNHFNSINLLFMTGIAAGVPSYQSGDQQVRLGDVVVSDGITQYDYTKETPEEKTVRSNMAKPSARAIEAFNIMKAEEYLNSFHQKSNQWYKYIDQFSVNSPFSKPAPDTDKLYDLEGNLCEHPVDSTRTEYPKVFLGKIASANNLLKNPKTRNMLNDNYGAIAVEMEASGIADATWEHEVGYLVVRGICDYGDTHKNNVWQEYASLVAAAYTRAIIEKLPSNQ